MADVALTESELDPTTSASAQSSTQHFN